LYATSIDQLASGGQDVIDDAEITRHHKVNDHQSHDVDVTSRQTDDNIDQTKYNTVPKSSLDVVMATTMSTDTNTVAMTTAPVTSNTTMVDTTATDNITTTSSTVVNNVSVNTSSVTTVVTATPITSSPTATSLSPTSSSTISTSVPSKHTSKTRQTNKQEVKACFNVLFTPSLPCTTKSGMYICLFTSFFNF